MQAQSVGLQEGDRVLLCADHPYATHTGTILGWETLSILGHHVPKIQLDNGHQVFVLRPDQLKKVGNT
jgi:hypothetical protein